jgi:hypothetical protein
VSVDIFEPSDTEADETKYGPLVRDTIRLFVIRYGEAKRDTIFGLSDTSMLGNIRKALRHERLNQFLVNLNL